jgi:hypothetical protein
MDNGTSQSFGESVLAFREKHNISKTDIDPDLMREIFAIGIS